MSPGIIITTSIFYIGTLFLIAYIADRRSKMGKSIVSNPFIYALSLAVYCTAWTFYGSVGRASSAGLGFLPIYIGPTICAPLWMIVLRKIIVISKAQRITSIADFISSRYGKSTFLGILATIIAVLGIIPYISIQLKAIAVSFDILLGKIPTLTAQVETPFYLDSSLYIAIALAVFSILFGTRNLDPNERHEGLVAAIAFESLLKLFAFIAVGVFVTFGVYKGFGDLFNQAYQYDTIVRLFDFDNVGIDSWEWFWLVLLSMSAILFLPRQFHVAVVENTDPKFVSTASWLFPLYLLLINIFVIPIALAGLMNLTGTSYEPDTFVLSLPLHFGQSGLALLAGIGGFAAATSMVIVAVIALSIMISNHLLLPSLLNASLIKEHSASNLSQRLLGLRRLSIAVVILLAYGYFKLVGERYTLVSIGLISFTAIAQFLPAIIGGLYWKRGTKLGAIAGLIIGLFTWGFCLPFPTLVESGIFPSTLLETGFLGIEWLHPYHLFGSEGMSTISHAAFWSLLFNSLAYFIVSIYTTPQQLEVSQADIFVDIYKYQYGAANYEVMRRKARVKDLRILLERFLGIGRTNQLFQAYESTNKIDLSSTKIADAELVNYTETHLAGSIGAASAKVIIGSVSKADPISLEEMFKILEQTKEIIEYSKALEKKSTELEKTTLQLQQANEQLKELDLLKADFITTVTHELRTPMTSIKSLSKIILDHKDLPEVEKERYLGIVVKESERMTRLINQVLDLEKLQSLPSKSTIQQVDLKEIVLSVEAGLLARINRQQIDYQTHISEQAIPFAGNYDQLTQLIQNLYSNAIKFCDSNKGAIKVELHALSDQFVFSIWNNGEPISPKDQKLIFEKFIQVTSQQSGKPKGSGLGLSICKTIVEQHGGTISVHSTPSHGTSFKVSLPKGD